MAAKPQPPSAQRLSSLAGHEQDDDRILSDADLGVGEETPGTAPNEADARVQAAMQDPAIAAAVELLVSQRAAQLAAERAGAGLPAGTDFMAAMRELGRQIADSINRSTAATVEQMPGHVKPLPVEVIEERAAALVELESTLRDLTARYWAAVEQGRPEEAERVTPIYVLDEDFFGPGEVGSEIYVRGQTIRWFGPPSVCMVPRNDVARTLCAIEKRHLGEDGAPSAEDVAAFASQMMRPSTPGAPTPQMGPLLTSHGGRSRPGVSVVAELGIAERGPDNIVGTVVKVTRGGFGTGAMAHLGSLGGSPAGSPHGSPMGAPAARGAI